MNVPWDKEIISTFEMYLHYVEKQLRYVTAYSTHQLVQILIKENITPTLQALRRLAQQHHTAFTVTFTQEELAIALRLILLNYGVRVTYQGHPVDTYSKLAPPIETTIKDFQDSKYISENLFEFEELIAAFKYFKDQLEGGLLYTTDASMKQSLTLMLGLVNIALFMMNNVDNLSKSNQWPQQLEYLNQAFAPITFNR